MKYLVVWLGLSAGCGGPPILPVGLPPPEYERPAIPSASSAGAAPRVDSSPGGAPAVLAGESATAGSGGAGVSGGTGGSAAGTPLGGSQ
jgi:hypothetical protein